jgi:hypothetical protein
MKHANRKVYRTKSGVLVTLVAIRKDLHRPSGEMRAKGAAWRVGGGWHGWLWMHSLEVA